MGVQHSDTSLHDDPSLRLLAIPGKVALFARGLSHVATFISTSTSETVGEYALTLIQRGTGALAGALNVSGENPNASAAQVRGVESNRGSLKVTHEKGAATGDDSSASAISIDLQGAGTAAQGLYIDSTVTTTGKLVRVRNNSIDLFYIDASGNVFDVTGNDTPNKHGWKGWAYNPNAAVNTTAPTGGVLNMVRVDLPACTVTNLIVNISATPTSITSGQNFAGLYSSTGVLLGSTADQSTAWATTGVKTMALTATVDVAAGSYYVGLLGNASTCAAYSRAGGTAIANGGLTASTYRVATSGTGQIALPDPVTMGSRTSSAIGYWVAVS